MTNQQVVEGAEALRDLTHKQVEVLDLLVQHKTTKEIARTLDIAPNTVDQRLRAVREKWGTVDRKETARLYGAILEACGKSPCGLVVLDREEIGPQMRDRDLPSTSRFEVSDAEPFSHWILTDSPPVGLEAFDARFGKFGRVALICLLAFALAATVLLSLAIADGLSRLI